MFGSFESSGNQVCFWTEKAVKVYVEKRKRSINRGCWRKQAERRVGRK